MIVKKNITGSAKSVSRSLFWLNTKRLYMWNVKGMSEQGRKQDERRRLTFTDGSREPCACIFDNILERPDPSKSLA